MEKNNEGDNPVSPWEKKKAFHLLQSTECTNQNIIPLPSLTMRASHIIYTQYKRSYSIT